ncbi:hypothetical protein F5880DRAFT_1618770 [Lentinula raphanica]|nr:hypothetical protein F5880DRAFT_1618770 [Lentinula raphanica]
MARIESDTADFVFVNYPPTDNPPAYGPQIQTHSRPWDPNLSVKRLPLRDGHISRHSNGIPPIHGGPLTTSLSDDADAELCDRIIEDDDLSEEAELQPLPPSEAVVFTSTLAYMSGYTDYSVESYRNMQAKVVVARFSSSSVWILVGPVHSVMPTAIIPAGHSHLDSAFSECKIQQQIFLVHDLSSVVEHVQTRLTIRFLSDEFQTLCHALGSNSPAIPAVSIFPDWQSWLLVLHEFKKL